MKTVAIFNHGCKLNQFEGEAIAEGFKAAGFELVERGNGCSSSITIVNTCTVTEKSDRKSRNAIFRASRMKQEGGLLVVTGCYAQTNPDSLEAIEGVDLVIGNSEKPHILEIVQAYLNGSRIEKTQSVSPFKYSDPQHPQRSRVFVKIQDGCNGRCSYCKVPVARGKSKSRDFNEIKSYVQMVSENGYKEVVLTGINLGDYKCREETLSGLLTQLLQSVKDLRIRLSSIEPMLFEEELFSIIRDERIAPHFHIPLQSGSNRILQLMNRPYSVGDYVRVIERLDKVRPNSHLATDVIVGFPTEHEEDFESTAEMIEEIGFASLHVFKYSKREGTEAAHMRGDVPYREKVQRSNQLIKLSEILNYRYRSRFLGERLHAIFERHNGGWQGVTDNYIKVRLENSLKNNLNRRIVPVKITHVDSHATYGVLV